MNRIPKAVVCFLFGMSAVSCGDENKIVPQNARVSVAPTTPPTPPPPPRDHEGVPNHGAAAACAPVTGDVRAMRQRLRALERGREPTPPAAASLLEGCAATPRDIAKSLEKAGRAIGRARAHDYAAAAAYFRRAIEIDPSYASARLALAGARSELGDFDGALYQLDQIKSAGTQGSRVMGRVYSDRMLGSLRMQPRFWTWAGNPVPEMVAMLPGATEAPLASVGSALVFTPPLDIRPEVIFTRLTLTPAHYRMLGTAVSMASGNHIALPTTITREHLFRPWVDNLSNLGASVLLRPAAFRFGDGQVVLALPFVAGEEGAKKPVVLIAQGPAEGPYQIVKIIVSTPSCNEPVLFTSGDRRVLGFLTSCTASDDPISFGRCVMSGEGGRLVTRCGVGASTEAIVGATDVPDDIASDVSEDEEAYEEEEEAYGDDEY